MGIARARRCVAIDRALKVARSWAVLGLTVPGEQRACGGGRHLGVCRGRRELSLSWAPGTASDVKWVKIQVTAWRWLAVGDHGTSLGVMVDTSQFATWPGFVWSWGRVGCVFPASRRDPRPGSA